MHLKGSIFVFSHIQANFHPSKLPAYFLQTDCSLIPSSSVALPFGRMLKPPVVTLNANCCSNCRVNQKTKIDHSTKRLEWANSGIHFHSQCVCNDRLTSKTNYQKSLQTLWLQDKVAVTFTSCQKHGILASECTKDSGFPTLVTQGWNKISLISHH